MDTSRTRLFQSTVACWDAGAWWLMNRREGGFRQRAIRFNSLIEICQDYAVNLGATGRDEHSEYVEIIALHA